MNILDQALHAGLLPVFDDISSASALPAMMLLLECGIPAIEVADRQPDALERFKALDKSIACLGAGTIMSPLKAKLYILAGAQFIVGPGFNNDVARVCREHHTPYMPGFQTPTEMFGAIDAGAAALKFFPAEEREKYFRHIKKAMPADLSHMKFLASGGPSLYQATDWVRLGFDAIVLPQRELAIDHSSQMSSQVIPEHVRSCVRSTIESIVTLKREMLSSAPAAA